MKYYHATTKEAAESIKKEGKIRKGWDGVVYLCESAMDACKFLVIRQILNVVVFEVELDPEDVMKSYDHNREFFGCDAYIYDKEIQSDQIRSMAEYEFERA